MSTATMVMTNEKKEMKKVLTGSALGNMIEWFDYASYGYLATIIATVFFSSENETIALLNTFAVFALSFLVRPLGGLIWGYYGDRIGRKKVLILTMSMMSLSTFFIGLIPSYSTIGIFSPILLLLCRVIQGFSASGEYAGASIMIAEHAPKHKRGLFVSLVPASTAAGLLLGATLTSILQFTLTDEALHSWGWRIPFLLSFPLGIIGLMIRLKMEDSPVFHKLVEAQSNVVSNAESNVPSSSIFAGIRKHWVKVMISFGVICLNAIGFYIILSYMPTYLSTVLNFDHLQSTWTTIFTLLSYVIILPIVGNIADTFGRKRILIAACILFLVFTLPIFLLMSAGGLFTILSMVLLGAILACNDGVLATFLSEMFPNEGRYSGFAFSFNAGNAIFGGTAPYVATLLISTTGNDLAPAFYLIVGAVIALIALIKAKDISQL